MQTLLLKMKQNRTHQESFLLQYPTNQQVFLQMGQQFVQAHPHPNHQVLLLQDQVSIRNGKYSLNQLNLFIHIIYMSCCVSVDSTFLHTYLYIHTYYQFNKILCFWTFSLSSQFSGLTSSGSGIS